MLLQGREENAQAFQVILFHISSWGFCWIPVGLTHLYELLNLSTFDSVEILL